MQEPGSPAVRGAMARGLRARDAMEGEVLVRASGSPPRPAFALWWRWVGASLAASVVGAGLFPPFFAWLDEQGPAVHDALGGAGATALGWVVGAFSALGIGLLDGVGGWLVLRAHLRRAGWWVAATAATPPVGYALGVAVFVAVRAATSEEAAEAWLSGWGSVALGLLAAVPTRLGQAWVLRAATPRGWYWAPPALAAGVAAQLVQWAVGIPSRPYGPAGEMLSAALLYGVLVGGATGLALVWVLRERRPSPSEPAP
jgi:hypothetical protein